MLVIVSSAECWPTAVVFPSSVAQGGECRPARIKHHHHHNTPQETQHRSSRPPLTCCTAVAVGVAVATASTATIASKTHGWHVLLCVGRGTRRAHEVNLLKTVDELAVIVCRITRSLQTWSRRPKVVNFWRYSCVSQSTLLWGGRRAVSIAPCHTTYVSSHARCVRLPSLKVGLDCVCTQR